jgi:outer membrane protein insertion porin family
MRAAALGLSLVLLAACASSPDRGAPEGEKHLEFAGIDPGDENALRELVAPDLKRYLENPRSTALDDAAFRLRYRFQFDGYADVVVTHEETPTHVTFTIHPGTRYVLGRVRFEGNTVFSNSKLRGLRPTEFLGEAVPFSERLMVMIREEIMTGYRREGYIEADVTAEEQRSSEVPGRVDVTFRIQEGRQFILTGIQGVPETPGVQEQLSSLTDKPYTPGTPERVEAIVIDGLRDHGYPNAQALATPKIDQETAKVRLIVDVRTGPSARIAGLRITGNRRTRDSFIESRVDLENGQPYRAADLRRSEERLQKTQLFHSARVLPGTLNEETGDLVVDVSLDEKDPGEFAIRAGYGSDEGIRAGADVSYMDLLGGAELIRVGGTISSLGYRTDAELAFPFLLGTDLRPAVSGWAELQNLPSFDARSVGVVGEVAMPVTDRVTARTGLRYAVIHTSNVQPGVPPGDLLDFAYTAVFANVSGDFVDNPRLPTSGWRSSAEVDWSPEGLRSDVVFVSVSGRISGYFPLPLNLVLATSFQGGIILPYGKTTEIPISLRYFAGGVNTVRGFKIDSIGPTVNGDATGGEVYMAAQSEIRFPIWGDVHGAVFSDQGGVWFEHTQVAFNDTRWSVGLGLRYYTAVGAFVADVGFNPRRQDSENLVEFHFSIGFPF